MLAASLSGDRVKCVSRHPDWPSVSLLAIGTHTGRVSVVDIEARTEDPALTRSVVTAEQAVRAVLWTPEGVLCGTDAGAVLLLDSASLETIAACEDPAAERGHTAHNDFVRGLAATGDGRVIFTCGDDRTVKAWSFSPATASTATQEAELPRFSLMAAMESQGHYVMGVAVRPGSTLASWTTAAACLDGSVLVWTTQSDAAEPGLRRLQGHKAGVNAVAFTPGGTTVLSASDDGTVKVWDLKSGKCTKTLEGHVHNVSAVAAISDKALVSCGEDGCVRHWQLSPSEAQSSPAVQVSNPDAVVAWPFLAKQALSPFSADAVSEWLREHTAVPTPLADALLANGVDGAAALRMSSSTPETLVAAFPTLTPDLAATAIEVAGAFCAAHRGAPVAQTAGKTQAVSATPLWKTCGRDWGRCWSLKVLPATGKPLVAVGTDRGLIVLHHNSGAGVHVASSDGSEGARPLEGVGAGAGAGAGAAASL